MVPGQRSGCLRNYHCLGSFYHCQSNWRFVCRNRRTYRTQHNPDRIRDPRIPRHMATRPPDMIENYSRNGLARMSCDDVRSPKRSSLQRLATLSARPSGVWLLVKTPIVALEPRPNRRLYFPQASRVRMRRNVGNFQMLIATDRNSWTKVPLGNRVVAA